MAIKTWTMRYPGDPPCRVELLTRAEFLIRHPRQDIQILDGFGPNAKVQEVIPVRPDEIHCDLCYADPGEMVYLVADSRAYCGNCAAESLMPYC